MKDNDCVENCKDCPEHGGTVDVGCYSPNHTIPEMTNPLGDYWLQPNRKDIEVDDIHALMSQADFDKLANYSMSNPSGVYVGKMWKCKNLEVWYLYWWKSSGRKDHCEGDGRKILIV